MKTYEMLKWGKGYYVATRVNGRAYNREWFKTKTTAAARVKVLKGSGYVEV